MPFTLSHPAAAVPLARRGLALSALVVGSMSPDFIYFVRLAAAGGFGHTLPGIILWDVPVGLAVLWIFHGLLKYPLMALLPVSQQKRLLPAAQGFRFGPPRRFMLILLALAIGAWTHVVWDSFTHESRWIAQHSFLSATLLQTAYGDLKFYKVLQYSSTLLGATLLVYWYARWLNYPPPPAVVLPAQLSSQTKLLLIGLMGLVALMLAGFYSVFNALPITDLNALKPLVGQMVVTSISALGLELVMFGLVWRFIN